MINILADQNLYRLEEFLPDSVQLTFYNPDEGIPDLEGFNAWLLRTVTKVNEQSVPELPASLKFIGTGSSGSDHIDTGYISSNNISFADALGCNARAVAEYVLSSLLLWREVKNVNLQNLTYGIIGAGAAGSSVAKMLDEFGFSYILYDPPKQRRENAFRSASMEEVLSCDVLTFHTPFTRHGEFPTNHWLDEEKLKGRTFEMIINAARGGVIKESAVLDAVENGSIRDMVIDVWEGEPDFDPDFAVRSFIATPHIAGYSEQAKLNASKFVCEKLCSFFNLNCPPTSGLYSIKTLEPAHINFSFKELLLRLHPLKEYDAALRDLIGRPDKARLFAKLRVDRPYRYEYNYLKISENFLNGYDEFAKLGIKTY